MMASATGEIEFTLANGEHKTVPIAEGDSLMQAAARSGIAGIVGECGGEMSCATCHVWIGEEWPKSLRRRSQDEVDLLDADDLYTDESKLSCQIRFTAELNGLNAVVPSEVNRA